MSEALKIAITAFFTILTFVIGQFVDRLIINPIHEFRALLGEISHDLIFYANIYCNQINVTEPKIRNEAYNDFRRKASLLISKMSLIPFYRQISTISSGWLPDPASVDKASRELIGLSNEITSGDIDSGPNSAQQIKKLLGLEY